jgi:hypothetical protein
MDLNSKKDQLIKSTFRTIDYFSITASKSGVYIYIALNPNIIYKIQ